MSRCKHENLLRYYGHYWRGRDCVFVMEFAELGSLATLVTVVSAKRVTEAALRVVASDVVRGLRYLHHAGVCHRNLRNETVLFSRNGEAKLADFGPAPQRDARLQTMFVHPYFLSPEVLAMPESYPAKADVWSLGVVIVTAADGDAPHRTQPPLQVRYATSLVHCTLLAIQRFVLCALMCTVTFT